MEKIHWSKLTLVDGDGDKYNTDNNRERFIEAMKEYRQTEEICGFYFSEPLPNQQNIEHCAGWGPQVQEIDWTGIDGWNKEQSEKWETCGHCLKLIAPNKPHYLHPNGFIRWCEECKKARG